MPPHPFIASAFPIRGTAVPDATIDLYILPAIGDIPIPLSTTQSGADGRFTDPSDVMPYVGQYLVATATDSDGHVSDFSAPFLIEAPCALPTGPGDAVCYFADAVDDDANAEQGGPAVTVDVLANDTYTYPLRLTEFTAPSADQGTVVYNDDGTFTFTPSPNFHGDTTFTYSLAYESIAEEPILYDPTGAINTAFGTSVVIDGDTAIVGASTDSVDGPLTGCAYVYHRVNNTWILTQRIANPAPQGTTYFGECVGITGDRILIANNHGTEYEEFDLVNGVWQYAGALLIAAHEQNLVWQPTRVAGGYAANASDEGFKIARFPRSNLPANYWQFYYPDGPLFGDTYNSDFAVDIEDRTAVAAASFVETSHLVDYLFSYALDANGNWRHSETIELARGNHITGVGISGDDILISMYEVAGATSYRRVANTWTLAGTIPPMPNQTSSGNVSTQIAMKNGYALIGTYADTTRPLYAGLYAKRSDNDWQLLGEYGQPAGAFMSASVALDDGLGMIGIAYDSQPVPGTGTVRPLQILAKDTATVTIHVATTLDAVDDAATTQQGVPVSIDVAANDTYPAPLLITAFTPPAASQGTATYDGNGQFTFTPAANFAGKATFDYTLTDLKYTLEEKLLAPDGSGLDGPGTHFGYHIAMDGNTAITASELRNKVYIFDRIDGAWQFKQSLEPPVGQDRVTFGWGLAISGDTIVVGDEYADAAHFYVKIGQTWDYLQTVTPQATSSRFGYSVSLTGDVAVVGAPLERAGAAYVYRRSNDLWELEQRLAVSNSSTGGQFGISAATNGHLVAVASGGTSNRLVVHTFERTGPSWVLIGQPDPALFNNPLGGRVALLGDTFALVTSPDSFSKVFEFQTDSDPWQLISKISAPAFPGLRGFGNQLALGEDAALLGTFTPGTYPNTPPYLLYGFAYARSLDGWQSKLVLTPSDGYDSSYHAAVGVAISGTHALVGFPSDLIDGTKRAAIQPIEFHPVRDTATVTIDVVPNAPVITSAYPIRGTAAADVSLQFYVQSTIGGPAAPLGTAQSDANGDFLSDIDTLPFVGQYLTATATADGLVSEPSAPVLIVSPCPAPSVPGNPSPADGSTMVAPNATLTWDDLPSKSLGGDTGAPPSNAKAWEPTTQPCGTPIDLDASAPANGVAAWDGNSFAREGVVFSAEPGSQLYLARDEVNRGVLDAYIMATASTTGFPADKPVIATFLSPATCVSFNVLDVGTEHAPWTVTAYDASGGVLSTLTDTAVTGTYRLAFPGIHSVKFSPSTDREGFNDFAFTTIPCPTTFDVDFGTAPVSLAKICADAPAPACSPGPLATYATYYWQVVAKGVNGNVDGPIWSFTTRPATVAVNDAYTLQENAPPTTLDVLANDLNDTGPLTISSFTLPASGTLTKNVNNTFTYQPAPGFSGNVQFTYTVPATGPGSIITANVAITVLSNNSAPIVAHPAPDITVPVSSAPVGLNASLVFADPDGDLLTFTVTQNTAPALVDPVRSGAGFSFHFTPGQSGEADLTLRATDPSGLFAEDTLHITVGTPPTPPVITQQPQSQLVNFASSATFTCSATSNVTLTYRWQRNSADLSDNTKYTGTDTPQLTVLACANADEAAYRCVVSNGIQSAATNTGTLTVRDPYIAVEPTDAFGGIGGTASFSVAALGTAPLAYQWYIGATPLHDGAKYTGATSPTLTIHDLIDLPQNTDEQLYHVEIQGGDVRPAVSRAARLTISDPFITQQPAPQTVREGATATFSLTAIGTEPILYRWMKDGAPLSDDERLTGTQSPTLSIAAAIEDDEGDYTCTVVGQEIVVSAPARLSVTQIPAIIGLRITPNTGIVPRSGNFSIEVLLDGPTDNLHFSWTRNGQPIMDDSRTTGSTTALLAIANASPADAGSYLCTVSDAEDSLNSPTGEIHVGLTFRPDLGDTTAEEGQRFTWRVRVLGQTGPVAYAWYRQAPAKALLPLQNNARISGTDTDTLTIDPLAFADEGHYTVFASDDLEVTPSAAANLHVVADLTLTGLLGLAILATLLTLLASKSRRSTP